MKFRIMRGIGTFVPQQITVRSGLFPASISFKRTFPAGKSHGTVRMGSFQFFHNLSQVFVAETRIFTALEHHGAESEFIAMMPGGKNFLFRQTISLHPGIPCPDPAVVTVVPTVIGELDQSAQINFVSVDLFPDRISAGSGRFLQCRRKSATFS